MDFFLILRRKKRNDLSECLSIFASFELKYFKIVYPSLALHRCKGMPLSLLGRAGVEPIGLWRALSLEPPELRCLELVLSEENKQQE